MLRAIASYATDHTAAPRGVALGVFSGGAARDSFNAACQTALQDWKDLLRDVVPKLDQRLRVSRLKLRRCKLPWLRHGSRGRARRAAAQLLHPPGALPQKQVQHFLLVRRFGRCIPPSVTDILRSLTYD